MAVKVVVLTTTREYMMRVGEHNGLLVYHNRGSPTDRPIRGWIIPRIPQAVSGGKIQDVGVLQGGIEQ
jgi:hypothetical protein